MIKKDRSLIIILVALCVLLGLSAYVLVKDNHSSAEVLKNAMVQINRMMQDPSLKSDGTSLIGSRFIEFELPNLSGGIQRLELIRSELKLIVVFSVNDCELCFNERLLWSKLTDLYPPDRLAIIGICSAKEEKVAKEFVNNKAIKFPVLWDPMNIVKNGMGFRMSPLRIILDKDNKIINIEQTQTSLEAQKAVANMIDALINGSEGRTPVW